MKQHIKPLLCSLLALLWGCLLYAQPNITRVEYYIDKDPGYNNATAVSITPGTNLSNIALNISTTTLASGVHTLGIRAKDANGAWSEDNRWLFVKPYAGGDSTGPVPNLNRIEYYLDADPGYGKATAISFAAGTNLSGITLNIDPSTLASGVHTLGIRARDANGGWSHSNRWLFAKPYPTDTSGPLPNVTRVEYYLDKDPGYGAAKQVSISAGTNLSNLTINIDTTGLAQGVHILGVRARDANGKWSDDNKWLFARPYASDITGPGVPPNLRQIEYYIDNDPGYGKGTQVATDNISILSNFNLSVNISGLATGNHTLYIRSKDAKGGWSLDNNFAFRVSATVAAPSITLNSVSKKTMCVGDVFSVGFDAKGTFNSGNVFTVQLSNSTGSFASPATIGTATGTASTVIQCTLPTTLSSSTHYRVRAVSSNPAITSNISVDSITVNTLPSIPTITANGPATFCQGGSVMLTSSASASYKWSTNATTQSITVSAGGSYTVTVANSSGCKATSASKVVTVNANPVPTTTPTGNVTIASGSSINIKVNETYNAYLWSTGAATQGITVNSAGSYTCKVTNSNGCQGTTAPVVVTVSAGLIAGTELKTMKTTTGKHWQVAVYPNPATTRAELSITGTSKPVTVTLTDLTGKTLWKAANVTFNHLDLPIANLNASVYLITITDGVETKVLKLVKGQE
jgi:hypothetical protein